MTKLMLIAKPDTWYKAGTEVFLEDPKTNEARRITNEDIKVIRGEGYDGSAFFVGIRVADDSPRDKHINLVPGEELWDGEWCSLDEFYILEDSAYLHSYPNEAIGGDNPYYCCSSCGISDPQVNGMLLGHGENCEWKKSKIQQLIKES